MQAIIPTPILFVGDTEASGSLEAAQIDPGPPPPRHAEAAETLSPPPGASEAMLTIDAPSYDPLGARIAMTRLSRELGRDYRLQHGVILTANAAGIDQMQQRLRQRICARGVGPGAEPFVQVELARHAALLSEILARALGAEWVALGDVHPTDWSMRVPPGITVWPIWRVHNFLRQHWSGRGGLLSLYEDLAARRAAG